MESTMFNQSVDSLLSEIFHHEGCDLVNMHTFKYRLLNDLMAKLDLTFNDLNQLTSTHTPVLLRVAQEMLRSAQKRDNVDKILALDCVQNEHLQKLIRLMCKSGHTNIIHTLLAIDGLGGSKLNNGPHFDCKKYVDNLKYGLSGEQGRYDREAGDLVKRTHVCAIRKIYQELDSCRSGELVDSKLMYQVMCRVLNEYAYLKLPQEEIFTRKCNGSLCKSVLGQYVLGLF
ncbi:uncharacterized protein NPIL_208501 [Nephila pilipes]|uniref:Uncharacterized protein n=1 Tax=Nephila pilipes TaxID=299642 RepID=A0A8X6UDF3_NEPPI|nr:uncharacterized protein NPIL_208501 [Nephila pilipes]